MKNILRKNLRLIKSLGNYRFLTSPWRRLPDFLIIGAMKSGTTSLYYYLTEHPNILKSKKKEVNFFNRFYENKSIYWYKSYFNLLGNDQLITGEATPHYLYYSECPQRIVKFLPQIKLIVLLRNPVDRAYSHYYRNIVRGYDNRSFEEAISFEKSRLENNNNNNYSRKNHRLYSYLSRGKYAEQLQHWLKYFPREQFLILKSEDFFRTPAFIFNKVLKFLDLPPFSLSQYEVYLPGQYAQNRQKQQMKETTKSYLQEYFLPYNNNLYKLLDRDFQWN